MRYAGFDENSGNSSPIVRLEVSEDMGEKWAT